jgi:hypothetical protein
MSSGRVNILWDAITWRLAVFDAPSLLLHWVRTWKSLGWQHGADIVQDTIWLCGKRVIRAAACCQVTDSGGLMGC